MWSVSSIVKFCVISTIFLNEHVKCKSDEAVKKYHDLHGGLKMPSIGLGTWEATDSKGLENALDAALEIGYRHIDTAFSYGNEASIGRILKKWFDSGKLKREDIFITTKLSRPGIHPDRVELFMNKSLTALGLDYVDLYLIHSPIGCTYSEDPNKPVTVIPTDHVAVWKKMEEQVDAGRAKTIGLSNFNVSQVDRVLKAARIKPASLQVELHVYLPQHELVKFAQDNGIVVVAYSPLGNPGYNQFLASLGKEPKPNLPDMLNDKIIKGIGEKHNKTSAQVMLRYLLQRDIVPIPKSVKPERLRENFSVFDFELTQEDMKALDDLEVGEPARVVDFKFVPGFVDHPEYPFNH